jgi:hypothetical protein
MGIHKEGYKILAFGLIILLIVNIVVNIIWADKELLKWAFIICSLMLYVFLLFFFRLPVRRLEADPGLIYAPADGKVVVIEETISGIFACRSLSSCHLSICIVTDTLFQDGSNMFVIIRVKIWLPGIRNRLSLMKGVQLLLRLNREQK